MTRPDRAERSHLMQSVLTLAILGLFLSGVAGQEASEVSRLRAVIDDAATQDSVAAARAVPTAALEAGTLATPFLRGLLGRSKNDEKRELALLALAYIGGPAAVELLRREWKRTAGTTERSLLAFAIASTGSKQDRAFLIRSLKGEHFGDAWMPIVSAALSLGVLRAREAIPALEATARKVPDSISSHAAAEALRWIRQGRWSVDVPGSTAADRAIATVIANGIPRTDEAERFYDSDRQGYWQVGKEVWTFARESGQDEKVPSLSFKVHIEQGGNRALVSTSVYFGPLNAVGYDYVLRRESGNWLLQGVFFTWIS